MNKMTITSAQYATNFDGDNSGVHVTINGKKLFVPLDPANTDYAEIMRQVEAGELTIQEADSE